LSTNNHYFFIVDDLKTFHNAILLRSCEINNIDVSGLSAIINVKNEKNQGITHMCDTSICTIEKFVLIFICPKASKKVAKGKKVEDK